MLKQTGTCKVCLQSQPKIRAPIRRSNNPRAFVYTDGAGGRWSGQICPSCNNTRKETPRGQPGVRLCRKCRKPLPVTKYFHHTHCEDVVRDMYDEYSHDNLSPPGK